MVTFLGAVMVALALQGEGGASAGGRDLEAELVQATAARALDPDDPAALERLAELWALKGDKDSQIAYTVLLLGVLDELEVDDEKSKAKDIQRVSDSLAKLDPSSATLKASRDRYLEALNWALELYEKNRKIRNALDVAGRILLYKPQHKRASRVAASVPADASADFRSEARRLLGRRELSRPRAFLERWAGEHADWSAAGTAETDGYIVRTNIGYDTLRFSAQALENLAVFYRGFYDSAATQTKGKTEVDLFRTRTEFERLGDSRMDKQNPGLKGFIAPTLWLKTEGAAQSLDSISFAVYSYDPRDEGRPLSALFEMLSHEASHQYMLLSTGQSVAPPWLNEGMASYFEGALIRPDGEVQAGLPARGRMLVLPKVLELQPKALGLALEAEHQLPGILYPVAWGLVYYLYQHQAEDGAHPYRADLKEALRLVRGGQTDGEALLQEAVLDRHGLTLSQFEANWKAAMQELRELERVPDAAAAHYLERGQKYLAAGAVDAAREAFERVLTYQPRSAPALLGLAQLAQRVSSKTRALPDKDVTLLWARRAHRAATLIGDTTVEPAAADIAREADPGGFDRIAKAEASYRKDVQRQIERQLAEGRPKTAVALAAHWQDRVLGDESAPALLARLRAAKTLELERAFAPFDGRSFMGLACSRQHYKIVDGELHCWVERPERGALFIEQSLAPRFRMEGELWLGDSNTSVSLCVELPWLNLLQGFTVRPVATKGTKPLELLYPPFDLVENGWIAALGQERGAQDALDFALENPKLAQTTLAPGKWVPFALDRSELDVLELWLDGRKAASRALDPRSAEVRASVTFFGGEGRLRKLRIVERDRL